MLTKKDRRLAVERICEEMGAFRIEQLRDQAMAEGVYNSEHLREQAFVRFVDRELLSFANKKLASGGTFTIVGKERVRTASGKEKTVDVHYTRSLWTEDRMVANVALKFRQVENDLRPVWENILAFEEANPRALKPRKLFRRRAKQLGMEFMG